MKVIQATDQVFSTGEITQLLDTLEIGEDVLIICSDVTIKATKIEDRLFEYVEVTEAEKRALLQ